MKKFIIPLFLLICFIGISQDPNVDDFNYFQDLQNSSENDKWNRIWLDNSGDYLNIDCITGGFHLIFEDNFDASFSGVNGTKWNPITGVPRDFNFDMQKAWHLPENNVLTDGTLKITAKKLNAPYTGKWVTDWGTNPYTEKEADFDYTTGEIWSKYRFHYGVYEIRCKIPKGRGFWPAFWTSWGNNPSNYGEIDVFEFWNEYDSWGNVDADKSVRDINTNMWHWDRNNDPGENYGSSKDGFNNIDVDFSAGFHVITMIYDPGYIAYLVDGVPIRFENKFYREGAFGFGREISCEEIEDDDKYYYRDGAMPHQAMHIVANLAIQYGIKETFLHLNDQNKAPDADTPFPSEFEIDYIRHWKKFDCPTALYFPDKESLDLDENLVYNTIMGTSVNIDNTYFNDNDQLHIIYSDYIEYNNVEFSAYSEVTTEYFTDFDCSNQGIITSGTNVYNTQKIKDDFFTEYEKLNPVEIKTSEKIATQYILYDLNGRIIQQGKVESNIQFPDLKKGMYIYIELDNNEEIVKHQKLIF